MQRIFTLLVVMTISIGTFAQTKTTSTSSATLTCEQRESRLLSSYGTLSAVAIYNTYITVGGITDLWTAKAYKDDRVKTLFDEQKAMLTSLSEDLDKLVRDKALKSQDDTYYVQELNVVVKGLKKQIEFFLEYLKDKNDSRITTYDNQRKKNWDNISKLLGLDN